MTFDPDAIWLTYDEAAERLGIKADSVRRRAAARKWPKRQGNDGKARVGIPPDVIPAGIPAVTPDNSDEIRTLRTERDAARAELARADAEITRLSEMLSRSIEAQTRPSILIRILERVFRLDSGTQNLVLDLSQSRTNAEPLSDRSDKAGDDRKNT